jgi:hypothetical protein
VGVANAPQSQVTRAAPAGGSAGAIAPSQPAALPVTLDGPGGLVRSLGGGGLGAAAVMLFLFAFALAGRNGRRLGRVPLGTARHAFLSPLERPG